MTYITETLGFDCRQGQQISFLRSIQTGPELASLLSHGYRQELLPEVKEAKREVVQSPRSSMESLGATCPLLHVSSLHDA
jgi:hypothetical protein